MTLLTEEQRKKLSDAWIKAPFVNENCIGCSACVAICPDVFDLSEETYRAYVKKLENYDNPWINDAISACPVSAISWK